MSKPEWARRMGVAGRLERDAQRIRAEAQSMRCTEEDSAGVQCTGDAGHSNQCRWNEEDLP